MYTPRMAAPTVQNLAAGYPAVTITGPRQSGKTSLVRQVFPQKPYVSLENLDRREFATEDPRGVRRQFPDGAILDEVQRTLTYFPTIPGSRPGSWGSRTLHPAMGTLFETWVVSELLKARYNRGLASNLFFWRVQSGANGESRLLPRPQTLAKAGG